MKDLELENLWNSQMERLEELLQKVTKCQHCWQIVLEIFHAQHNEIIDKASHMDIPKSHIPFVLVIPQIYLGPYGLMSMVRNNNKVGFSRVDPDKITDEVQTPKKPYAIYNVENGDETLINQPEEVKKTILKENRSCLTVAETIALCVHSKVLLDHFLACAGSRYGNDSWWTNQIPFIYLDHGWPVLDWCVSSYSDINLGTPSCYRLS